MAKAAPGCRCELHKTSPFSPQPVAADETLVRMVIDPMFVSNKAAEVKPNFFGHAFSKGLSVQRLEIAEVGELKTLVTAFLADAEDRAWVGYVSAPVHAIRNLTNDDQDEPERLFCVYDTSEKSNPAHAEVGIGKEIEEADAPEYRRRLVAAFDGGRVQSRKTLKQGAVWNSLEPHIQGRAVPERWLALS